MRDKKRPDSLVAANLRRVRTELGASQYALAEWSGIHRAHIAAIEGGRYKTTTVATVAALADALRVPVTELFRPIKRHARQ